MLDMPRRIADDAGISGHRFHLGCLTVKGKARRCESPVGETPCSVPTTLWAECSAPKCRDRQVNSRRAWKGEGAGIFEVLDDHRGDTYIAVYAVRFEGAVYVHHAFQKKSPSGIKTAQSDVKVNQRLKLAKVDYEARHVKARK